MMRASLLIFALLFALPAEAQRPSAAELKRAFPSLQKIKDLDIVAEYAYPNQVKATSRHGSSVVGRVYERTASGELRRVRTDVETHQGEMRRLYRKTDWAIVREKWWKLDSDIPGGLWVGVRTHQARDARGYSPPTLASYMRQRGPEIEIFDVERRSVQRFGGRPEESFSSKPSRPSWLGMAKTVVYSRQGLRHPNPRRALRNRTR